MRLNGPRRKKIRKNEPSWQQRNESKPENLRLLSKKELGLVSPQRETLQGTQGFSFPVKLTARGPQSETKGSTASHSPPLLR